MDEIEAIGATIHQMELARRRATSEGDAAKYRALQTPEKIDQLALELSMMGVKVPARDTAFFQAAVMKWLTS